MKFHIHDLSVMIGRADTLIQIPAPGDVPEEVRETFFSTNDNTNARELPEDKVWVRAVPLPYDGNFFEKCRAAYAVFSGRAYAVRWPKPGDLEKALYNTRST